MPSVKGSSGLLSKDVELHYDNKTHEAVGGSELHVVKDGPHGINVSPKDEFNTALLTFLAR